MKTITETRMLRYNFTPEEHLANAAEMARLADSMSELESSQKSIKAQLKEDLEAVSAEFGRHVRLVRDKCDHRKIECRWIFDCPAVGQKTLRRNDTDMDVEVRRMEEHEKQESLNLVPATEDLPLESTSTVVETVGDRTERREKERADATNAASKVAADINASLAGPKRYSDAPADFRGSLEEWHAHCDKMDKIAADAKQQPPAMPETAKAEAEKKSRFGPQKV